MFHSPKPVIGVVHLLPLPASPRWGNCLQAVWERAEQEATALATGGVQGILVENFFDAPFVKGTVDAAVVSAMTLVVQRLRQIVPLPIGINVLRNDAHSALAIAACTEAAFIRVNVLTGVMATDQGIIEGDAHRLLRYRRELGCDVKIFADVLVKHARPISSEAMAITVHDTLYRGLADAVIVSGLATGAPPRRQDLEEAAAACGGAPVLIGSGANDSNIAHLLPHADGVIVSSSLKRGGQIQHPVDPQRVRQFTEAVQRYSLVSHG